MLGVDASSGLDFRPDVVKVAYLDRADGMERMHADPAHERIEKEVYPRAAPRSVWITGRAG